MTPFEPNLSTLAVARDVLLTPFGLDESKLLKTLGTMFTHTTGSAHWEVLLRARAIENQCYVLAAAQGGTHASGRRTFGHSMLIDPWGKVTALLEEGEGVVVGEIDQALIDSVRSSLPALKHRRL